jgi:hypothetical protein
MDLWTGLPTEIAVDIVSEWLTFSALVRLDNACCSHASRAALEECLQTILMTKDLDKDCGLDIMKWFVTRKLCSTSFEFDFGALEDVADGNTVSSFFRICGSYIESLYLRDSTGRGLRIAWNVANYCANLHALTIEDGVSLAAVTMMLSSCPKLVALTFSDNPTSALLEAVGRYCPGLEDLTVGSTWADTTQVDDAGLLAVAQGCPKLTQLCCKHCKKITAAGIASAVAHWPHLKQLTLRTLNAEASRAIAASCPVLDALKAIQCTSLTDADLQVLSLCGQLTRLHLGQCPELTGAAIRSFTKLKSLSLSYNHNIDNDEVISLLEHVPHLTELSLLSCSLLDRNVVLRVLERAQYLTSLSLSNEGDPARMRVSAMAALVEDLVRTNLRLLLMRWV